MSARPLNLFLMSRSRVMTYSLRSNIGTKMHIHKHIEMHSVPPHGRARGASGTFDSIFIADFRLSVVRG